MATEYISANVLGDTDHREQVILSLYGKRGGTKCTAGLTFEEAARLRDQLDNVLARHETPQSIAAQLRAEALAICKAQPGYGTPNYRGDPMEAVLLKQRADRLDPACCYCDEPLSGDHAPSCEMLSLMSPPVEQLPGGGVLA